MIETSTQELRSMFELLMRHIEESSGGRIEIAEDYYWVIPEEPRYDLTENPSDFDVGQLTEDLENLRKMVNGTRSPVSYGLVWLSALLTRTGETMVP